MHDSQCKILIKQLENSNQIYITDNSIVTMRIPKFYHCSVVSEDNSFLERR